MRLTLIASILFASTSVNAFAPSLVSGGRQEVSSSLLQSTAEEATVSATEFHSKLEAQLAKLAAKDANSKISANVSFFLKEE
jgi:hypothetical protein